MVAVSTYCLHVAVDFFSDLFTTTFVAWFVIHLPSIALSSGFWRGGGAGARVHWGERRGGGQVVSWPDPTQRKGLAV